MSGRKAEHTTAHSPVRKFIEQRWKCLAKISWSISFQITKQPISNGIYRQNVLLRLQTPRIRVPGRVSIEFLRNIHFCHLLMCHESSLRVRNFENNNKKQLWIDGWTLIIRSVRRQSRGISPSPPPSLLSSYFHFARLTMRLVTWLTRSSFYRAFFSPYFR